jgi:hypothetical protein
MALNFANNNSLSAITTKPSGLSGGAMTLLSTQTASSSANVSFTSGIDDTYDEYVFKFYNMHPATDDKNFQFQGSTDGGSSYGVTITSTVFRAGHGEDDSTPTFGYFTADDLAQSTSYQRLDAGRTGNDNDSGLSGTLQLFSPSSTTFVKHFIHNSNTHKSNNQSMRALVAGYFNTTSAIDAINFQFASGNIDSGVIKLYGVS